MDGRILIIGAGQAGAQAAASLRAEGWTGPVTLVGDEPVPPYQRPPLSKAYLAGEMPFERLMLRPDSFWAEQDITLATGIRAEAIDRAARTVAASGGRTLHYDHLILATGTRARTLAVPGASLDGVYTLRTTADAEAIGRAVTAGMRLTVVGAGYIGLEVAAIARKRGAAVTVFELAPRAMARTSSAAVSAFFEQEHTRAGVAFHFGAAVAGFEGTEGRVTGVIANGEVFACDAVLCGIGAVPNMELAFAAGLPCTDGIVVDEHGRTADPHIWAAGDCTHHACWAAGRRLRLESVQNAIDQAKHVALALCGKAKPYQEVPWFWSDQYDLKLQIAGIIEPGLEPVLRGDPAARKFAVFHLKDGAVHAVEAVNAAPEYMVGRTLIAKRARLDPAKLSDTSIPMKELAR